METAMRLKPHRCMINQDLTDEKFYNRNLWKDDAGRIH